MDSTVIQEIANQLGMATDQAGKFITDNLPVFAGMKSMYAISYSITSGVIFVVCLIALIFSIRKALKARKKEYNRSIEVVISISITIAIISGIALIITGGTMLTNILAFIGWTNYPEAMLVDMAITAIG